MVWAAGYYADEDYFLSDLRVEQLSHLKRGQNLVSTDGVIHNVRLERHLKNQKKIGDWKWPSNPFLRQREFNGLRVLMGVLNDWDLKDANNSLFEAKEGDSRSVAKYNSLIDSQTPFRTGPANERVDGMNWLRRANEQLHSSTAPSRAGEVLF